MASLRIAAECASLINAAASANFRLRDVIKSCTDARRGLLRLYSELCALGLALECLSLDSTTVCDSISDTLQQQTISILDDCDDVVNSIDDVFRDYDDARANAPTEWAWAGKDKAEVVCQFVKSYKCVILLSISIMQLCALQDIDPDAPGRESQKADVKANINEAIQEINQLPISLSETGLMHQILSIQSHLDALTQSAKSLIGGDIDLTVTVFTTPPVTSSVLNDHDNAQLNPQPQQLPAGPSQPATPPMDPMEDIEIPKISVPGPGAVLQVKVRETQACPRELEELKFVPVASTGSIQALWAPDGKRFIILGIKYQNVMADIRSDKTKLQGFYSTSAKFFPLCENKIFIAIKYRSASQGLIEIWDVPRDLTSPILVNTVYDIYPDGSWDVGVRHGREVLYLLQRKRPSEPLVLCVTDPFSGERIQILDDIPTINPLRPPFVKASATGKSVLLCKHAAPIIQLWTHTSRPDQSAYNFREIKVPHSPETQREISIEDTSLTLITPMQVFSFDTTSLDVKFQTHDFSVSGSPNELIVSSCGRFVLASYSGSDVMKLWEWRTGEVVWNSSQHWMTQWKFAPDDRFLIGIRGSKTKLFEITNCCTYEEFDE